MKRILNLNLNLNRIFNLNLEIAIQIKIKNTIKIMNVSRSVYLVAIVPFLLVASRTMAADETNTAKAASARIDYQSFRLIYERNIFNPNRSSRSDRDRN